jgi:hypothetical protein
MNKRVLIITCLILLAPVCFASATEKPFSKQKQDISITILYDSYVFTEGPKSDWGFSCTLKGTEKTIFFDTGAEGGLFLENMEKLKIDPKEVGPDEIVYSFTAWSGLYRTKKVYKSPDA